MKEYRLTFATENFGAISQVLVDLGVSFRVEPVEAAAGRAAPARVDEEPAKPRSPARKPVKTAAKKKTGRGGKGAKGRESPAAGAERVLERWSRGEGGTGLSPAPSAEVPAPDSADSDETSA
jgi:hypothetical protein